MADGNGDPASPEEQASAENNSPNYNQYENVDHGYEMDNQQMNGNPRSPILQRSNPASPDEEQEYAEEPYYAPLSPNGPASPDGSLPPPASPDQQSPQAQAYSYSPRSPNYSEMGSLPPPASPDPHSPLPECDYTSNAPPFSPVQYPSNTDYSPSRYMYPTSPEQGDPFYDDAEYMESSKPPESPIYDEEGQVSDDEDMDYVNYIPGDGMRSDEDYEIEELEEVVEGDGEEINGEGTQQKMKKQLKSKKRKDGLGASTRRTVRSFLDGKLTDDADVTTPRQAKSERLNEDGVPIRRDDRAERRKKKKKYDQERAERMPTITFESRPNPYNPHSIAVKLQSLISRVDGSNIPDNFYEAAEVPEDDIVAILMEAIELEQNVDHVFEKRELLIADMEKMLEAEKEVVRKLHADLPDDIKESFIIDGDYIGLAEGQTLVDEQPVSLFPSMPSLLGNNSIEPLAPPPITANGLPMYSFSVTNGNETPAEMELGQIESPEKYPIELNNVPTSPVSEPNITQPELLSPVKGTLSQEEEQNPPTEDLSTFNTDELYGIYFAFVPLHDHEEETEEECCLIESYQLPPNPGAPGVLDTNAKIFRQLVEALDFDDSAEPLVANTPASPDVTSSNNTSLLATDGTPQKERNPPPSLMSLTTKDPYGNIVAPPTNFRARRSAPQNPGRSGHAESPTI